MECLWNKRRLEQPAPCCFSTREIDATKFLAAVRKPIDDLRSFDALRVETMILERLVYRMKSKFRSDKGLKNMEKVRQALSGHSSLELEKEYERLESCVRTDGEVVSLPSKQMLQYALVRTQSFAKLSRRVESTALCAASFFKTRIQLGHAWAISLTAYAVIARIWILARYLIRRCCTWYNDVRRYVNACAMVGAPWLPRNCSLPVDLEVWLDLAPVHQETHSILSTVGNKTTIFELIKVQSDRSKEDVPESGVPEEQFSRLIHVPRTEHESTLSLADVTTTTITDIRSFDSAANDIGKPINRHTFESHLSTEASSRARKRQYVECPSNFRKNYLRKRRRTNNKLEAKRKEKTH